MYCGMQAAFETRRVSEGMERNPSLTRRVVNVARYRPGSKGGIVPFPRTGTMFPSYGPGLLPYSNAVREVGAGGGIE